MSATDLEAALKKIKGVKTVYIGAYNRRVEVITIETIDGQKFTLKSDYDLEMEVPHIVLSPFAI